MLEKLNFKRDKIVDIQKALKSADANNDKELDFDEWRHDLKRWITQTRSTFVSVHLRGCCTRMIVLANAKY